MTYRVHWGEDSWDVDADTEDDAIAEIVEGLAQFDDRFAYPGDPAAIDELSVEPAPAEEF